VTAAAAVVTAVAAAIDAAEPVKDRDFDLPQQPFLDSIQSVFAGSLELLESAVFPFAPRRGLKYLMGSISEGTSILMIVCSCNVLSDHDVRSAVNSAQDLPRNARQVYGCLGCSVECGRCASTVKSIVEEALGACAKTCQPGCPHGRDEAHAYAQDDMYAEFSLAAS